MTGLFGLHSLRSGGASAANNLELNDSLFKRHGCWWCENAKDGCERLTRVENSSDKKHWPLISCSW